MKSGMTRVRPLGLAISTLMRRSFCGINLYTVSTMLSILSLLVLNLTRPMRVLPLSLVVIALPETRRASGEGQQKNRPGG